jgi:hypothetical protein
VDPTLAFFSGVGVSLVGVLTANLLAKRRERQRFVEERRFEIYVKLMELQGEYFWFTVAEMHREHIRAETSRKAFSLAWQIADALRAADEVEYLEEILDVTHGPGFATAQERYDAMSRVLERLGRRVNPRYAKKIHEISEANMSLLASGGDSNAPALSRSLGLLEPERPKD